MTEVNAEKTLTEEARRSAPRSAEHAELFVLAHVAGDRNMRQAADRLREMSSLERRELRKSIQRLDYLMDDVSLELMAKRAGSDE